MNKLVVKVGERALLRFTSSLVYRAITVKEMIEAVKQDNVQYVIIEDIEPEERDELNNFVKDYLKQNIDNYVAFYDPNGMNKATGVADENNLDIFMEDKQVYDSILEKLDVYMGNDLNIIKQIKDKELEKLSNEFTTLTDITGETSDKNTDEKLDENSEPLENSVETDESDEAVKEEDKSSEINLSKYENIDETLNQIDEIHSENEGLSNSLENTSGEELGETDDNSNTSGESIAEIVESSVGNTIASKEDNADVAKKIDITATPEYIKLETKHTALREKYNSLLEDIKIVQASKAELAKLSNEYRERNIEITERFKSIIKDEHVEENPIPLSEYKGLQDKLEEKENRIESLQSNIADLNGRIERLKASAADKDKTVTEYEEEVDKLNKQIAELNESIEDYEKESNQDKVKIADLNGALVAISKQITKLDEVDAEIADYKEKISELEDTVDELQGKLKEKEEITAKLEDSNLSSEEITKLQGKLDEADKQIESLKSEVSNSNLEIADLQMKLEEAEKNKKVSLEKEDESEKQSLLEEIAKLEDDIREANEKLESNEFNKERTQKEIEELKEENFNTKQELLNIKEEKIKTEETIKDREILLRQARDLADNKSKEILTLQRELQDYKGKINNQSALVTQPINYSGKAEIINVFGSGSYGITTTAVSLAQKLVTSGNKVVLVDFDMMKPKIDGMLNMPPTIPGSRAIADTALALSIENGVKYFKDNLGAMISTYNFGKVQSTTIAYLGGIYYNINESKVANFDYTEFLNVLSTMYDYIIIDFGKLRASRLGDSLIASFSRITDKNILVTIKDPFEIRNTLNALDNALIPRNNVIIMMNLCANRVPNQKITPNINGLRSYMMLMDRDFYGREGSTQEKLFTSSKSTREAFNEFLGMFILNFS